MTSNCDDCGMSQFGDLSIQVNLLFYIEYCDSKVRYLISALIESILRCDSFIGYLTKKISPFIQVCGSQCCVAEDLDNKFHDDFDEGELSTFQGDVLGECDGFDIGKALDWSGCMTLYHSGIFFFLAFYN